MFLLAGRWDLGGQVKLIYLGGQVKRGEFPIIVPFSWWDSDVLQFIRCRGTAALVLVFAWTNIPRTCGRQISKELLQTVDSTSTNQTPESERTKPPPRQRNSPTPRVRASRVSFHHRVVICHVRAKKNSIFFRAASRDDGTRLWTKVPSRVVDRPPTTVMIDPVGFRFSMNRNCVPTAIVILIVMRVLIESLTESRAAWAFTPGHWWGYVEIPEAAHKFQSGEIHGLFGEIAEVASPCPTGPTGGGIGFMDIDVAQFCVGSVNLLNEETVPKFAEEYRKECASPCRNPSLRR